MSYIKRKWQRVLRAGPLRPVWIVAIGLALVIPTIAFAGAVSQPAPAGAAPAVAAPFAHITKTTALNWAGYYATGSDGSVTKVTGTWVEPKVKCGVQPSLAVFWLGMDGVTSQTVEQTGTQVACVAGVAVASAWYELYPRPVKPIANLTVAPGDHVTASVTYASSDFDLSIEVAGHYFNKTVALTADRSSAECIVERTTNSTGFIDLTNFGVLKFKSCKATVDGSVKGIGAFGTVGDVVMKDSEGHVVAEASGFTAGKTAFNVTWKRAN